jgi:hypothetical protein
LTNFHQTDIKPSFFFVCRARDQLASQQAKPRKGQFNEIDSLTEPLLGRGTSGLERPGKFTTLFSVAAFIIK